MRNPPRRSVIATVILLGSVAPLAVGGELWTEWMERAAVLVDAGMDREQAELRAADELGVLRDGSDEAPS